MAKNKDDAEQRRLRERVAKEINDVMDKHKVGGVVLLASQQAASWTLVLPKWAGIAPDPLERGFRLRLSSKTPEAHALAESTLHLIGSMRDMAFDIHSLFGRIFRQATDALTAQGAEVEHHKWGGDFGNVGGRPDPQGGKGD